MKPLHYDDGAAVGLGRLDLIIFPSFIGCMVTKFLCLEFDFWCVVWPEKSFFKSYNLSGKVVWLLNGCSLVYTSDKISLKFPGPPCLWGIMLEKACDEWPATLPNLTNWFCNWRSFLVYLCLIHVFLCLILIVLTLPFNFSLYLITYELLFLTKVNTPLGLHRQHLLRY